MKLSGKKIYAIGWGISLIVLLSGMAYAEIHLKEPSGTTPGAWTSVQYITTSAGVSYTNTASGLENATWSLNGTGGYVYIPISNITGITNMVVEPKVTWVGAGMNATRLLVTGTISIKATGARGNPTSGRIWDLAIDCPAGYTGSAIKLNGQYEIEENMNILKDIVISCGTVTWGDSSYSTTGTAINMTCDHDDGEGAAIAMNTFGDIYICGFQYGIQMWVDDNSAGSSEFINGNQFHSLMFWNQQYSLYMQSQALSRNIDMNKFDNIIIQCSSTEVMPITIDGAYNSFTHVIIGDSTVPKTVTISNYASGTFISGLLGLNKLQDNGGMTIFNDIYLGPKYDFLNVTGGAEIPTLWGSTITDIYLLKPDIFWLFKPDQKYSVGSGLYITDLSGNFITPTVVGTSGWDMFTNLSSFPVLNCSGGTQRVQKSDVSMAGNLTLIFACVPWVNHGTITLEDPFFGWRADANNRIEIYKTSSTVDTISIDIVGSATAATNVAQRLYHVGEAIVIVVTIDSYKNTASAWWNNQCVINNSAVGDMSTTLSTLYLCDYENTVSGDYLNASLGTFIKLPFAMNDTAIIKITEGLMGALGRDCGQLMQTRMPTMPVNGSMWWNGNRLYLYDTYSSAWKYVAFT